MQLRLIEGEPPVTLGGEFILPNVPNGMPVNGHARTTLTLPRNRRWSMPIWSGVIMKGNWLLPHATIRNLFWICPGRRHGNG
jgi:hypothetical protein